MILVMDWRKGRCRLHRNFFGLNSEDRITIFAEIHEIVFHGGGGYTWEQVYDMPLWLRKFTYNKLKEYFDKQSGDSNTLINNPKGPDGDKPVVHGPAVSPKNSNTYATKLAKK